MNWNRCLAAVLLCPLAINSAPSQADEAEASSEQLQFFERSIRPLLSEHCFSCHSHSAEKIQAGLVLDTRNGLLTGGDSGPAIEPGDAESSLLMQAVRYEAWEMPPKGKLSDQQIADLETWIQMGAPWPKEQAPDHGDLPQAFDLQQRRSEHWVWQPMQDPPVPSVASPDWPQQQLDHFVLSSLEQADLPPAEDTDRGALLRRLSFDITGLPPTPAQVIAFEQDTHPDATARAVDALLASPHFGERWARHWLDLVRYAESRGHEFDNDAPNAYQYRDYVIRALNADVPYDQFVREHIAGDLLDSPRLHPTEGFNESILGTGFWFLGEWVHSPVDIRKDEADRFDNMLDVMSKSFLGVTVACARCHDHKFDAISTADYYALSGFLQSSDYRQVRFESLEHNRRIAQQLADVDQEYRQRIATALADAGLESAQADPAPVPHEDAEAIVVNFDTLDAVEYRQDGYVFGPRPQRLGDLVLAPSDETPSIAFADRSAAVSDTFWDDLKSVSEKGVQNKSNLARLPRSGRTLRTPTFTVTDRRVDCRVRGEGHIFACVDSHRMVHGPLHRKTIVPVKSHQRWVMLDLKRYIGHRVHLEFTPARKGRLEVSLVLNGASEETRQQLAARESRLAEDMQARTARLRQQLNAGGPAADHIQQLIETWTDKRSRLRQQVQWESRLAMAMLDGSAENDHLLIRGNASRPGPEVPRRFLTAIAGDSGMPVAEGSGRLQLAAQINAADNPLTSRVIANRTWHHLMGRGIVPTTDDFGVLGQRPSHPELLDHLATWFLNHDRSLKQLIRYIVLSRTYQMSSRANPVAVEADPKNLLWHHRPPQRLQGEVIRDALLFLSGELDDTLYGEPVPIHLTSFMDGRGRPKKSGPLDGHGRRSIYVAVRRNFLSPFMLTFDTPVPFSSMGRRNQSNVPAQALILMNDPFVAQRARGWAQRVIREHGSAEDRIAALYETGFARTPTDQEQRSAEQFVRHQFRQHNGSLDDVDAWSELAHALINTKEFIFLR